MKAFKDVLIDLTALNFFGRK